ncbi:hypothetical protein WDU94_001558 [Cyamophila willieti]
MDEIQVIRRSNKKVIKARDQSSPRDLPIFWDNSISKLSEIYTELETISRNKIQKIRNEIETIRKTGRTFRSNDVNRIDTLMRELNESIFLVNTKGEEVRQILEFPYKMHSDPESSDSELDEEHFKRPSVLTRPWAGNLLENTCGQQRAGVSIPKISHIDDSKPGEENDKNQERRDNKSQERRKDNSLPRKLVIPSKRNSHCDELFPRLIYCDEYDLKKGAKQGDEQPTANNNSGTVKIPEGDELVISNNNWYISSNGSMFQIQELHDLRFKSKSNKVGGPESRRVEQSHMSMTWFSISELDFNRDLYDNNRDRVEYDIDGLLFQYMEW